MLNGFGAYCVSLIFAANLTNYLKRFSTITLLLVLIFSHAGYYWVLQLTQLMLKENAEETFRNNYAGEKLVAVCYTDNSNDIFWEEEGKEFLFKGAMYDVVKISVVKGHKILYCINDVKEKQLIDKYNLLTKNNSGDNKKQKNNNFQQDYFFDPQYKHLDIAYLPVTSAETYFHVFNLSKGICDKNFPPPKA